MVASHLFKGLNLNHLHLNAVKQKNQDSNNKEEEGKEKERNAPQCTVKSTASDWKKRQYAQYREYELRREVQRRPEYMAQQSQPQYEPYQPSLGPANDHSPNDPNPLLEVSIDQTRHMVAATQSAPKFKSLHQKVTRLCLYMQENKV